MDDIEQTGHEGNLTNFGFARVRTERKQEMVDDVFHKVALRYDLMNDLMSGGLHREWKNIFVSMVRPSKSFASRHLDVAGGTGDIAFRIAEAGNFMSEIVVADINESMLGVCRERAEARAFAGHIETVAANAESLPFRGDDFDSYTIAFGIRNVPRIDAALAEAYRTLKFGGHFLCLEFSALDIPLLDRLYDAFSFKVIPAIGKQVTGDAQPYRYLVESIRKFPAPAKFERMIRDAGFQRTSVTLLSGGAVAIHSGWKL